MIRTHYVKEITSALDGKTVTVAGWVHEVRDTAKIKFLILRDTTGTLQVIGKKGVTNEDVIKIMSLPKESVVRITGVVKASGEAKAGFEIMPDEVEDLNPLSINIPFEVTGKVPVDLDVRLNYRYIDLRRTEPTAIFKIESTVLNGFRNSVSGMGFEEIRTPSMIAEASEGGSDLFPIAYFEKAAYLAQSPQLYKQLAIIGGMDRVYMIMPVFRAEKSNTVYHLTESTQMDIEMAFANSDDVIKVLSETVLSIIRKVKEENKRELEIVKADLKVPEVKIVTYSEAVDKLKTKGFEIEFGHDISRGHETALQKIYGDAVIVRDFPASLRAFYSMPKEDNPELTHSFDFIYKGLEITSGAQRIHKPDMLIKSLEKKGLNPKHFDFYINAFRCGAPPHSGWSIGLERLTMQITGAQNIRESSLFPRDRKRLTP
jgi:nondiscriminating aspartyl-tRNA synthetase